FFDNIDHELMMRAVRKHTQCKWVLLYIERWLRAPAQLEDGTVMERDKGTPQGGVISPLLANLFLHYAFDTWMERQFPGIPFERYADDIICHCRTERQAKFLLASIEKRLAECRLEVNRQKTRIVYCKNENRPGNHPNEKFDFLGFTFRPRASKSGKDILFVGFSPAVSDKAAKAMRQTMRGWRLYMWQQKCLEELAQTINPVIRGWLNYYGSFYKSALFPTFECLEGILSKWAVRKYKRFKGRRKKARLWLRHVSRQQPQLFVHWQLLYSAAGQ
ncbi:MAG: reverse transcriptase domain-containing protein, partial [Candidatus Thorarchaeota archaeon]